MAKRYTPTTIKTGAKQLGLSVEDSTEQTAEIQLSAASTTPTTTTENEKKHTIEGQNGHFTYTVGETRYDSIPRLFSQFRKKAQVTHHAVQWKDGDCGWWALLFAFNNINSISSSSQPAMCSLYTLAKRLREPSKGQSAEQKQPLATYSDKDMLAFVQSQLCLREGWYDHVRQIMYGVKLGEIQSGGYLKGGIRLLSTGLPELALVTLEDALRELRNALKDLILNPQFSTWRVMAAFVICGLLELVCETLFYLRVLVVRPLLSPITSYRCAKAIDGNAGKVLAALSALYTLTAYALASAYLIPLAIHVIPHMINNSINLVSMLDHALTESAQAILFKCAAWLPSAASLSSGPLASICMFSTAVLSLTGIGVAYGIKHGKTSSIASSEEWEDVGNAEGLTF